MSVELWVEGVIIQFKNGQPCDRAIIRRLGKGEAFLADIADGKVFSLGIEELEKKKEELLLIFLADTRDFGDLKFIDLTEDEQRETNRRYRYLQSLHEQGITKVTEKSSSEIIELVSNEFDEKAPHWQTVRNWNDSYFKAGKKIRGLYPKHRFKGSTEPKIEKEVLKIIRKEAKRYYKASQPTMASIVRNVEDKIIEHNLDNPDKTLKVPTFLTVQNRVLEGPYQRKQKSRNGANAFDAELADSNSGIVTTRVLERVEIDHTLLDFHVLHDDHETLLGRPNITVIIDHYSHMVLGFQLSFEKPSFASVCMACMNAFLPKGTFLEALESDASWPAHGIPEVLVTDNGNEFWGKNFISVADEIGSIFQYCPIRKGRYKSRVERFFGIVNSLVLDDLPGVVRKPGKSAEGYDARQEARMTYSEFKRYFVAWLTGVYHNLPIEDSGMTPNELWMQSEEELPIPVEDEMELTSILMATTTRELSKGGIRIFSLNYNTGISKDLYRRDGPGTVTIKYNPFDIGYILILDEKNKVYLKIDCEKFSYASGLSVYEHDKIREEARKLGKSKLDNIDLQKVKVKLAKEREALHARNRRRKTQTTVANAARSEKIGVEEIKLVVDNSKKPIDIKHEEEEESLSLDGWSVD